MVDTRMLLMIFFINFAYITLNTLRFMLTMKGYRLIAPLVSMVEITIYILGLSLVLDRLDNPRLCCWDQRWHLDRRQVSTRLYHGHYDLTN